MPREVKIKTGPPPQQAKVGFRPTEPFALQSGNGRIGQLPAFQACGRIGSSAPKAATPVLPIGRGTKPPALFGEPVDQHVEEQPDLGA